ncbi:MAG TPA: isoprenylcysteine carboxyl methyltransferase [Micromonosporaceae bacterium]|nr:isoprenylcysteine carboxyl methyltransferase [Micromonosporaceae bacterium]HCU49337.1 isoprenylcysteine carboxyl methyltransferase [Micromonosporaceae bacterium]
MSQLSVCDIPDVWRAKFYFGQERNCGFVVGGSRWPRSIQQYHFLVDRRRAGIITAIWFVLAPGIAAGVVPYWLTDGWQSRAALWALRIPGGILIAIGVAALIHSFVRFVVEGFGTPVPVAPPQRLVVGGLYRFVRNPMYVGGLAAILGQALWFAQSILLIYFSFAWVVAALFVRLYEEPTLARMFGAEYDQYRRNVRAWWPRLRPWSP